jgi:hypothetical protein
MLLLHDASVCRAVGLGVNPRDDDALFVGLPRAVDLPKRHLRVAVSNPSVERMQLL